MDAVSAWLLAGVVAPDAYTRLVERLRDRGEVNEVIKQVRRSTGLRVGRRYRRWLVDEDTWSDLVSRSDDSFERLVDGLARVEAERFIRTVPPDRERAEILTRATIRCFLSTLDPSLGNAVLDARAEERHAELLGRLDDHESYEERLNRLPILAAEVLRAEGDSSIARYVVDGVLGGEPRDVIAGWLAIRPSWLFDASAPIWIALAHLASAFGMREEASELFEVVGDLGLDATACYARAALDAAGSGDEARAALMLARSNAAGGGHVTDVIAAAIDEDLERVLEVTDRSQALTDARLIGIYAHALMWSGDLDAAIAFLEEALSRHPDYSHVVLYLSQFLLERSSAAGTTSRSQDLDRAQDLAVRSRDMRRVWRGDSTESARVACRAALAAGDAERVMRLGRVAPEGEAWVVEASDTEVQFLVAQAAMGSGNPQTARHVAESSTGFVRALVEAELVAAGESASAEDIAAAFAACWPLAVDEQDRVNFWISASAAGVEPLPGAEELAQRDDELPVLCTASARIANERADEAISMLRPLRSSEVGRKLLVSAYVQKGEVQSAVDELIDMGTRFDNPEHPVQAVMLLNEHGRLADASVYGARTLNLLPPGHRFRDFIHEVGVVEAHNRSDWHEMELRVRAWINESGAVGRRRWLLIMALFNQAEPESAWRVLQEDAELRPDTGIEAELWIALHSRFAAPESSLPDMLALVSRFPGDRGVRAAAVNAFFERGDVVLPDADVARWQALIAERAADPGPHDTFETITLPEEADDAEGLAEALRSRLEPQAEHVETWVRNVQTASWPYGVLSVAAGRTYTETLVQRAAGVLPVLAVDPQTRAIESAIAGEAMDLGRLIVDLSAITTNWFVLDTWSTLVASFDILETTNDAKRDALIASDRLSSGWDLSLGWDLRADRPVARQTPASEVERMGQHAAWVREQVSSLSVRFVATEDDEAPSLLGRPWMTAVVAARDAGSILWADDLGLRALARAEGVKCFGTVALLDALAQRGSIDTELIDQVLDRLRREYCVDFDLDPEWLRATAESEGYAAGAASLAFERPATWLDLRAALTVWVEIALVAAGREATLMAVWLYAAVRGLSLAAPPEVSVHLSAALLSQAAQFVDGDSEAFAACASAASAASEVSDRPDPLESALTLLLETLAAEHGRAQSARWLAQLGADLQGEHRATLRTVLFGA